MNIVIEGDSTTVIKETPSTVVVSIDSVERISVENNYGQNLVSTNTEKVLVENEHIHYVLANGGQGPQGIPGESITSIPMVAGSVLNGHTVVIANNVGKVINPTILADTDLVIGITTSSAVLDDTVDVQFTGTLAEPSWNWTLGLPIFVGLNGALTQVPPSSGVLQIIAYPILSNRILIDKQQPILIG